MSTRWSRPCRHAVWIVLLFLLAPIHFLQLLPHFSTHLVGDVLDTAEYPWNVWWTAHALLDHQSNPFHSNHMFYPLGMNLVQHTYTFLDGLWYTLVRPWVPLLAFHNLLTWMSIFLNSLAAYVLVFRLTGLSGMAFIGALAFGHSPILTSYLGTQSLIEPYLFVFFVWASYHLFEVRRYGWGVLAGILLGLAVYNYPYFFVFGLVWLTVLVSYRLFPWSVKPSGVSGEPGRARIGTVLPWLIFGLLFALTLLSREAWEMLKISAFFNTLNGLGFLTGIYFLLKAEDIFTAKRKAGREADPAPSGWVKRLGPRSLEWRPPGGKETVRILTLSALVLAAALLTTFPYTQSYLTDPGTRSAVKSLPIDFETFSVDLASFFAPMHPWLSGLSQKIAADWKLGRPLLGTHGFFGYLWMILLVAGISFFFKRPALRVWIMAWLVFFFFCLGPYLKFHGITYTGLVLPGTLLPKLPLLGSTRTLSRFVVPLTLCTVVIGCLILKDFFQKCSPGSRVFGYAGLGLVTAFETALFPYPLQLPITDYRVPAVYQSLAARAQAREGVLLDLPLQTKSGEHWKGKRETRTFFYQTVHGQYNVGGVSSKLDDSVFAFFQKLPGVVAFWEQRPITREELAAFLSVLRVDWIVLEKSRYDPKTLETYLTALAQTPGLKKFFEDADFVGFQVLQKPVPTSTTGAALPIRHGPAWIG
ncbi:MAG: hypothetical protein HY892_09065 [Deltaproteobacteria bacterium]|nr:hypothetical protein [Deltaproteobacteria bacterium]